MAVNMNTSVVQDTYSTYNKADTTKTNKNTGNYGKTIGNPTLSEEGQKYYEQLKKKYANMDFILVSEDQKANAQARAGSYANPAKTVVLIDEEKIERMARDENYRKQYEGIISNSSSGLSQLKSSLEKSGAKVKGYGMQVKDGGMTSFFAVLEKSSSDQKARIAKRAEEKKAEKKAAEKKADKKAREERLQESRTQKADARYGADDDSDSVVITANSIEELMQKINDYMFTQRGSQVQTPAERQVGQHVDFWG